MFNFVRSPSSGFKSIAISWNAPGHFSQILIQVQGGRTGSKVWQSMLSSKFLEPARKICFSFTFRGNNKVDCGYGHQWFEFGLCHVHQVVVIDTGEGPTRSSKLKTSRGLRPLFERAFSQFFRQVQYALDLSAFHFHLASMTHCMAVFLAGIS